MSASVGSLVVRLLEVAERASEIARACRSERILFDLLVQEKSGHEKNQRFVQDFKTLADVLVQETVRYYLVKEFSALEGHINGEESNLFTSAQGKTIEVKVMESEQATARLLVEVLDQNFEAARLLAEMVHRPICISLPSEFDAVSNDEIDITCLGIWIDPIDGTNEYVHGRDEEASTNGLYMHGLQCVTVLIGMFNRWTGWPLVGVVAQPFWRQVAEGREAGRWIGRVVCGMSVGGKTALTISPPPCENGTVSSKPGGDCRKFCVISSSESGEIKDRLTRAGWQVAAPSGAGYKLLSVIDGTADVFLLSKCSTFKWDTCGPQAILKACGGNVFGLAPLLEGNEAKELVYHRPECETEESLKWSNREGILAFRSREAYLKLLHDICS